eukprot:m51a1_g3930 hypothetical protein (378) ;mRNA; f:229043-230327
MNPYNSQPVVPLRFSVSVDSPSATFIVGERVTGHVFFSLPAPIRAKRVTVELVAESRVRLLLFGGKAVGKAVPASRHRMGVCRPEAALWEAAYMGEGRLPAGNSTLPFAIDTGAFPAGMPGSFEGAYGSVRFFLRARIERHSYDSTGDHLAELEVAMLPAANVEWTTLRRASEAASKESGTAVSVAAAVEHTGYLAGDSARVEVRVANHERSKCVEAVWVTLVQKTAYSCAELRRADLRELDKRQALDVPVGPGGDAVVCATLRVPACAAPTVASKRVSQTYHVLVEAVGARGTLALARAPVVVGTVRIPRSAKHSNSVAEVLDAPGTNAEAEQQHEELELPFAGRAQDRSSGSSFEGMTNLKASFECRPPLIDLLA